MERAKALVSFTILIQVVVSLLFVITGLLKIADLGAFLEAIKGYQLVPYSITFGMTFFLPWLEVVTGVALFIRSVSKEAALILLLLVVSFIIALSLSWIRGLDVSCGCFGGSNSTTNYPLHIGGNFLLLGGLYWLLIQYRFRKP